MTPTTRRKGATMSSTPTKKQTTTNEPSEGATGPEIVPQTLPEEEKIPLEPESSKDESSEEDDSDDNDDDDDDDDDDNDDDDDDDDDVEEASADNVEVIDIATVTNTRIPPAANTQQLNPAIRPYIIGETYKRKY